MLVLSFDSLRIIKNGLNREEYLFDKFSLIEGDLGLFIWDEHVGRELFFQHCLNQETRSLLHWNIDGEVRVSKIPPEIHGSAKNAVLIGRNPEGQFSECFDEMFLEFSLPLALKCWGTNKQRIAAEFWLSTWGLANLPQSNIHHFSIGQKQRLLLASASALAPKLLLIDSPLEFLDAPSRKQALALLRHLCRARRTATLVASSSGDYLDTSLFDKVIRPTSLASHRPVSTNLHGPSRASKHSGAGDAVRVSNLRYRVPGTDRYLYNGLSVSIPDGASVLVVGPNGSGKSTLAHILGGRLEASAGSVELYGMSAQTWFRKRAPKISCAFDDPDLTITKTCVDSEINEGKAGVAPSHIMQQILILLGLDNHLSDHPFDLDWHTRRKLGIAKAIRSAENIIFFDEPAADSSPSERAKLVEVLHLCREVGLTVIVTTNDDSLANCLALDLVVELDSPKGQDGAGLERVEHEVSRNNETHIGIKESKVFTSHARWESMIWSKTVKEWFAHTPEFSTFWAYNVYPTLIPILDNLSIPDSFVMVDLACGNGIHTMSVANTLRRKGASVKRIVGLDQEGKFIEAAQCLFGDEGAQNLTFSVADLTDMAEVESLASALLVQGLPVLFTAFFSLHDLSSLTGLKKLFTETRVLGGCFVAVLVSPEFVEKNVSDVADIEYQLSTSEMSGLTNDWRWRGLLPVSAERNSQLYVPYFHRETRVYEDFIRASWDTVSYSTSHSKQMTGMFDSGILPTGARAGRDDDILFFWTEHRLK